MLGAAVRPDLFLAMRLPGHPPDLRWWPRFFRPVQHPSGGDMPTAPYGGQSTLTIGTPPRARLSHEEPEAGNLHIRVCDTSRRRTGIRSDPPDATNRDR